MRIAHFPMETITEKFRNLYVHFPFCETKCHYCDFFSLPEAQIQEKQRLNIYDSILQELDFFTLDASLNTVFLGGGTPSLVPLEIMKKLMAKLPLNAESEVTIEANPSSITKSSASAWRSFGINRVSMGVQALDDERLLWLGRVHSKNKAYEALTALYEGGFENVSIDYIVGVPGQTAEKIQSELDEVLGKFPMIRHLSAYLLTLKTANPKCKQLPDEETQLEHLQTVSNVLKKYEFEQYEISNFARNAARAKHNENYWLGGSYLGIGPSAHSYWTSERKRTKNWASLGKYTDLIAQNLKPVEWDEELSFEQQRLEYLMLRLRRSEGVDLNEYESLFGHNLYKDRQNWIHLWQEKGLCKFENFDKSASKRLSLTRDGMFLSDKIISNIS